MKLIVILVNLSLILLPLKSEENIPNNLIQAKINNPFKLSKITYRLNNIDHISRTELTSTQLEADSKLEHFYILDPLFTVIEEDNPYKTIRASIGHFNRTSNLIEFEENVQIKISTSNQNLLLDTNKLFIDNQSDVIISPLDTYFQSSNFHIHSKKLTIKNFSKKQNEIIFKEGNIINPDTNEKLGSAHEINYALDSDILIMKGSAVIKNKNISIHADEIHYNPEIKKIIKSINSKIINNS